MKIIFLGPPGAGKGTLSTMVCRDFGVVQISTGDIFREAIEKETPLGKRIKKIVENGELVPDELTVSLVKERLSEEDARTGYILDGFPRTIRQAEALQTFENITMVVNLDIKNDQIIIERLSGRRICGSCHAIYHIKNNPPKIENKCDRCGEDLIIREDDEIPAIRNRLEIYRKKTKPLIDFYANRGILHTIDASGTSEEVYRAFTRLAEKADG
ncbi:MAG: adenylate kinase [Spirochaetales bacterium]|nr:adenylate kinase [Spirochaetales bacterium]